MIKFSGKIVQFGFGAVGKSFYEKVREEIQFKNNDYFVITANKDEYIPYINLGGITTNFYVYEVTKENYQEIFSQFLTDGDILIDGISINKMTRKNIHDLFIMVLQDTWLFDGSIKENLEFNKEEVSEEEIYNVLRVVGIDHFVDTLPGNINASVNDNDTISSGQKQLLTIARGMIKDAPFLILDEATSNVDTRTEELVAKAMDKLTSGRTSFIIAHRLSTIKNANLILVMNNGNVIEQGTHDELIKKNGFYAGNT